METQTSPIPTTQVTEKKVNTTYTFREITEADELEQAFRLRYEVYSSCRCSVFLNTNLNKIDIDSYDLHSKHFGLFINENELAGYFRVVFDKNEYYNSDVLYIGRKFNFFPGTEYTLEGIKHIERADFPFLSYTGIPESTISFYKVLKNKGEGIAECSRLIIKEEHRGVKVSILLLECAIVLYILICIGSKHAVLSCVKEHSILYKRYGFQPIGEEQGYSLFGSERLSMCLTLSLSLSLSSSPLPKYYQPKLESMAAEYSITGKITKTI
jgi:predicted GNAT family N-acyltransferase